VIMADNGDNGDLLGTVIAVLAIGAVMLMRACVKVASMG
jgi:energy-converting hydrogenase Eha subunit E